MPRIKEYRTQIAGAEPQYQSYMSGGPSAGQGLANLGERISQTGDMLYRRAEQSDVADVSKKMAEAHAQFTVRLKQTLDNPPENSNDMVSDLLQEYDNHLEVIRGSTNTPAGSNHAQTSGAQLRGHLFEAGMQGQSELAGLKARRDYSGQVNALSSSLVTNPSVWQSTLDLHKANLDALVRTGGLPASEAIKLQTYGESEIARSAVFGEIKRNPEMAIMKLEGGEFDKYIQGDQKSQLLNAARVAKERGDSDNSDADRAAKIATQNSFLERMTKNELKVTDILTSNLDPFGSGSKETFIQLLKSHNKEGAQTNPALMNDLFARIHAAENDPRKLRDENDLNQYFGKGLGLEDVKALRAEVQGRKTVDGDTESQLKKQMIEVAKSRLSNANPLLGIRDPVGEEQMQKFLSFFLTTYTEKKKQGKTAAELLTPSSPDYLGSFIGNYTRTPQQMIQDIVKYQTKGKDPGVPGTPAVPSGTTPTEAIPAAPEKVRKPGESPAAYLERMKGGS